MKRLVIDNIGPIKHVELNLKRINVIIGPQSVGKSCVLKIACFCAWAEKRIQLEQGKNGFDDFDYIEENLMEFHKLEGFVEQGKGARFEYKTDHIRFVCDFDSRTFDYSWTIGHWKYKRSRISYIPAERNIVAIVPNWLDVKIGFTNIRSFISDWDMARKMYNAKKQLEILDLGVKYYYDQQTGKDVIALPTGHPIDLSNASSGLQSVIPMWTYLDFLFNSQYSKKVASDLATESENEDVLNHIYDNKFKKGLRKLMDGGGQAYIGKIGMGKRPFVSEEAYRECKQLVDAYTKTQSSDIYLEEPEQNLFPLTQMELVYELLEHAGVHGDSLFVTTHSPYILYALNNCMLGGLVERRIPKENEAMRKRAKSWISPKEVSVWEMREGELSSGIDEKYFTIQDEDGLIRSNYFDRIMKLVMTDFSNYSNYYE